MSDQPLSIFARGFSFPQPGSLDRLLYCQLEYVLSEHGHITILAAKKSAVRASSLRITKTRSSPRQRVDGKKENNRE